MGLIDDHWDPEGEVAPDWTRESEALRQLARLAEVREVASAAGGMARRLGPEATSADLREDKRTARRVAHYATTMYGLWGGKDGDGYGSVEEARAQASVLDWGRWLDAQQATVREAQRRIATASKREGCLPFARASLHRLEVEIEQLRRIAPQTAG